MVLGSRTSTPIFLWSSRDDLGPHTHAVTSVCFGAPLQTPTSSWSNMKPLPGHKQVPPWPVLPKGSRPLVWAKGMITEWQRVSTDMGHTSGHNALHQVGPNHGWEENRSGPGPRGSPTVFQLRVLGSLRIQNSNLPFQATMGISRQVDRINLNDARYKFISLKFLHIQYEGLNLFSYAGPCKVTSRPGG